MTNDSLVPALQFADSFLPAGSFATSYGLEQFVAAGDVTDTDDVRTLVETYLARQVGPCEMVALRAAHDAAAAGDSDDLARVDRRFTAVQLPAEFRESSTRTGNQLLSLVAQTEDDTILSPYDDRVDRGEVPGNYPVVLGAVTASVGLDAREAAFVLGYSFVTDLLGAAQRVLRTGHTDVQQVLTDVRPHIVAAWEKNRERTVDEMTPFTPLVDIVSAEHERAKRRLFLS